MRVNVHASVLFGMSSRIAFVASSGEAEEWLWHNYSRRDTFTCNVATARS